ncbi:hypothetical protein FIU82_06095 [Pseudoalteromonas sp. THAF3]|uniref:phage tail terminator protein n=1 Tax=Pseudoalteromonas sp. THAF3 TaxID=2587843 RepID=UPI001268C41E|nr:hypothetical protein [Pseudoalteromonas sp. THAF3]QFU04587.1 hypothetical protein FIU82_06095 [Pseudoalteromonas sp. THAF3]
MFIRPITNKLNESTLFKTVRFSRDLPDLSKFREEELPAVYLLPASSRGGPEGGDLYLQQENLEVYSFCVVTKAPEPTGTDEPLGDALEELRRLLFGLQIGPSFSPLALGEGDLVDFTSRVNAWIETYTTKRTFRT